MANEIANYDYGEDAGAGLDDIDTTQRLPRLQVLQVSSQQCLKRGDRYVQGAEPGMIINSMTNELYEDVEALFVYSEHTYVAWPSQEGGGGGYPKYTYRPNDNVVREALSKAGGRTYKMPFRDPFSDEPLELTDTQTVWVLYAGGALTVTNAQQATIPFTSSNLQTFDQWTAAIRSIRAGDKIPPVYASRWKLSTGLKSNKSGQSWYAFTVTRTGDLLAPTDPLFAMAKDFRTISIPQPQPVLPAPERVSKDRRAFDPDPLIDDEIPF